MAVTYVAKLFCTYKKDAGGLTITQAYLSVSVPTDGSWSSTISTLPPSPPSGYSYFGSSCGYGLSGADPAQTSKQFELDIALEGSTPYITKVRFIPL